MLQYILQDEQTASRVTARLEAIREIEFDSATTFTNQKRSPVQTRY